MLTRRSLVFTLVLLLLSAVASAQTVGSVRVKELKYGSGSPEGVVAGSPGDLYVDQTNYALWLKADGTGDSSNRGWSIVVQNTGLSPTNCTGTGKALTYTASSNTFGCNTISGGADLSGTSTTQVLFNDSGSFGGDSDLVFVSTALPQPADPVLTAHGGTGTETCYAITARNAVGWSAVNPQSAPTFSCVDGPATLNNSGNNIDIATASVTGSTDCVVYRYNGGAGVEGVVGTVACGSTLTDIGTTAQPGNNNSLYGGFSDGLASTGLFTNYLRIPNSGNYEGDIYLGDDPIAFSSKVVDFLVSDYMHVASHGSSSNRIATLSVVNETTSGFTNGEAVQGNAFTTRNSSDAFAWRPTGVYGTAGSSATSGTLPQASGVIGRVAVLESGATLTEGADFRAVDCFCNGTLDIAQGFVAEDMTGNTNTYGLRGKVSSGSGKYNLYMDGTAPNYLKGALTVDALKAPSGQHCALRVDDAGLISTTSCS